jgi:hypothetical protein
MSKKMLCYSPGRYVDSSKIIGANVYKKDGNVRVAIDLDVKEASRSVVYTATFPDEADAVAFIQNLQLD